MIHTRRAYIESGAPTSYGRTTGTCILIPALVFVIESVFIFFIIITRLILIELPIILS